MKKNLALTGANGFLGNNLISYLKNDFNIDKINLRKKEYIQEFTTNIKKNKYDIIINCAASINPKNQYDDFINSDIPQLIAKSINKNNIIFIHLSTINVIFRFLNDRYTLTKRLGEKNLDKSKATVIRPNLIWSHDLGFSNKTVNRYINYNIPFYPMLYPGNTYKPVEINSLSKLIIKNIHDNSNGIYNIYGPDKRNLWELFNELINKKNKKSIKINLLPFEKFIPNKMKKILNKKQLFQQFLSNDRSIIYKNLGTNIILD